MLDRVKDTRGAIEVAFGCIFRAINAINACLMYIPVRHVPVLPREVVDAVFVRADGAQGHYELRKREDGLPGYQLDVVWVRSSPRKRKRV